MKIIGPASALRATVETNLPTSATTLFRQQMLPELWNAAVTYGIDPVGIVAQSGKETGWGSYKGNVKPEFYNTAGIKIRHQNLFPGITDGDLPLAHQMFPNWRVGAAAHAQHLIAYAGAGGLLADSEVLIVDPRFTLVGPPFVTTWVGLGGRWAPSSSYGTEIEGIMRILSGG